MYGRFQGMMTHMD
jgi:exonuclease VII large subunit